MIEAETDTQFGWASASWNLYQAQVRSGMVWGNRMAEYHARHGVPTPPEFVAAPEAKAVRYRAPRRRTFKPSLTAPTITARVPNQALSDRILNHVAARTGLDVAEIVVAGRGGPGLRARWRICRIMRRLGFSRSQIGYVICRDKASVFNLLNRKMKH